MSPTVLQQCLPFNHTYSLLGEGVSHDWLIKERLMPRFVHRWWVYFVGVSQKWTTGALQPHSRLVLEDSREV